MHGRSSVVQVERPHRETGGEATSKGRMLSYMETEKDSSLCLFPRAAAKGYHELYGLKQLKPTYSVTVLVAGHVKASVSGAAYCLSLGGGICAGLPPSSGW